ncbi:double-strand break repair protein AddB [Microvirga sp. 3-52]|uniref:double-strand break repair protein AddB n=1 Tax=Microvirga sp. 3-52 TaxID=2792425 RepID=UPI001AC3738F|nr:double-strand break repair protein AddB [Microvirga sp. 3-52]MBO1906762.1 double-strand break repair protein AddB [Microvirga sp. 3-52]MBS7453883.1 double-strand break repair protein AddB [Microvirga sp. 3-52]
MHDSKTLPHVFSIPPGCAFLPTLVDALLDGRLVGPLPGDPAALADITIYVPNRRATRALITLLAERGAGKAQLLPRIVPLGETDEAEFELTGLEGTPLQDAASLKPPIPPLERRLILTRLVQRWSAEVDRALLQLGPEVPFMVPASPADAVNLAGDLETLMDAFTTEGIDWHALELAVDSDYSKYFEITRHFVQIASENWPEILAERQASDPAQRRNALLEAEARRLTRERPEHPIIVAGSTGSVPATANLMGVIAHLPKGAIVLPGLDMELDEESWSTIGGIGDEETDPAHGHPQASLRRLLDKHLRMPRSDVIALGEVPKAAKARNHLLSEALRPAETTDRWSLIAPEDRTALSRSGCEGLAIIEAMDEREEALAIAISLRETIAHPNKTAALVTPDRALAARVTAELARWGLSVEDSAGIPLSDTPAGRLARLAAEAAADDLRPVRLLALLAHPMVRLGLPREKVEHAASVLEIGVLRGPAPALGIEGMRAALASRRAGNDHRTPRPRKRLTEAEWDLADELLRRLGVAFDTFTPAAHGEGKLDLMSLVEDHRRAVEALWSAADDEEIEDTDSSREALAALFDDLEHSDIRAEEGHPLRGRFVDYPTFFTALARQRSLSPSPRTTHRRLKILGLLEARLLSVDRVVLGGLDEGTWPPRAVTDAFLNRPMRTRVGLMPPERRIGQTAHDFVQALGTHDVVITRAHKRDGSPMVPSRFLQRLKAFTGKDVWERMTKAGDYYRRLARTLDTPEPAPSLPRPRPKPNPALFPRSLSVTEIETLVRDPYSIFARHILKLDALDAIAVTPSAADRGTIIHDVLGQFAEQYPKALPAHAQEILLALGTDAFADIAEAYPELYAEWWPRFTRLATEFVVWEQNRRPDLVEVYAERSGRLSIPLPDGTIFNLRARADRIEHRRSGGFAIIDFKTGQPPGVREVYAGFSPQLTLEAMMLMKGAFKGLPMAKGTPDLIYIHTTGGREPIKPREIGPTGKEARSVSDMVEEHRRRFEGMIVRYAKGEAAYVSRPFPKYARRFSEYDHLARVKEWSLASAGGEGSE